jgi:hypothetical protein
MRVGLSRPDGVPLRRPSRPPLPREAWNPCGDGVLISRRESVYPLRYGVPHQPWLGSRTDARLTDWVMVVPACLHVSTQMERSFVPLGPCRARD